MTMKAKNATQQTFFGEMTHTCNAFYQREILLLFPNNYTRGVQTLCIYANVCSTPVGLIHDLWDDKRKIL